MSTEEPSIKNCENCGEPLHGKYCAHCGQEDIDYKVSLKHLIPEVLHEYLGFDSQIFKSIPLLLFKPGYLTNEFNAGRRERYIPPLRMYFIVSLAFFLVVTLPEKGTSVKPIASVANDTIISGKDTTIHIVGTDKSVQALGTDSANNSWGGLHFTFDKNTAAGQHTLKFNMSSPVPDSIAGKSLLNSFFTEQLEKVAHNKDEFLSSVAKHYPEMMFFLLPACALLLKLLYLRRKRLYVEHLVFSLHVHSFAFIMLAVASVGEYFFANGILFLGVAWVAIIVYLFIAFLKVYTQRVMKTALKFILFLGSYNIMVVSALFGLFVITALLF